MNIANLPFIGSGRNQVGGLCGWPGWPYGHTSFLLIRFLIAFVHADVNFLATCDILYMLLGGSALELMLGMIISRVGLSVGVRTGFA